MPDDWIIEVLTDLKVFARQNGMVDLAAQLDTTLAVAQAELARRAGVGHPDEPGQKDPPG
jgi:hypothetical protein